MVKKFLLTLIVLLLLTACWDSRELDEIGIIIATGFDSGTIPGNISVTVQIINVDEVSPDGNGTGSSYVLISAEGATIFEAIRDISRQFDRISDFSHSRVFIISEELARQGVDPIFDFLQRSHEIYPSSYIVIAKGTSAREILATNSGVEDIQGQGIINSMESSPLLTSEFSKVTKLDFIKRSTNPGMNPIAGAIEIINIVDRTPDHDDKKTSTMQLAGTAVFNRDKLAGYLNHTETRGLNWVTGNVEGGILVVTPENDGGGYISIETKRANSSIKPEIENGKISFSIDIDVIGKLVEQQTNMDTSDINLFNQVESKYEEMIKAEITSAIDILQDEFKSDVLGLGRSLYRKHPKKWAELEDNWDSIFPSVDYSVEVNARLKRSGMVLSPIKLNE